MADFLSGSGQEAAHPLEQLKNSGPFTKSATRDSKRSKDAGRPPSTRGSQTSDFETLSNLTKIMTEFIDLQRYDVEIGMSMAEDKEQASGLKEKAEVIASILARYRINIPYM